MKHNEKGHGHIWDALSPVPCARSNGSHGIHVTAAGGTGILGDVCTTRSLLLGGLLDTLLELLQILWAAIRDYLQPRTSSCHNLELSFQFSGPRATLHLCCRLVHCCQYVLKATPDVGDLSATATDGVLLPSKHPLALCLRMQLQEKCLCVMSQNFFVVIDRSETMPTLASVSAQCKWIS